MCTVEDSSAVYRVLLVRPVPSQWDGSLVAGQFLCFSTREHDFDRIIDHTRTICRSLSIRSIVHRFATKGKVASTKVRQGSAKELTD